MRELRQYQAHAIDLMKRSLMAGHKRIVMQGATGFGKTLVAAHIIAGARAKGNRVTFCVPAITLIDQTVMAFYEEGITEVGVIQADHPQTDYSKPVQVASVQTLSRRGNPETDLVIVDECHQAHKSVFRWMTDHPELHFIGLSATPWTKGLGRYYDDLVIAARTKHLIKDGWLSPFRVFAPTHPDLTGVRTTAGDYNEGDLSGVMNRPEITADIVENWLSNGENRPTIAFCVDRAHARHVADQFEDAGVPTGYVDAFTPRLDREVLRKDFAAGRIKVVCNVGVLTTGVDWDVRCLILARPTKSEMLYVQIVGRALRTAEGKTDALIFDHTSTTERMGFVTDIHHETLDDGRGRKSSKPAEKEERKPKECSKCHFVKAVGEWQCPNCGHKPERREDVVVVDGQLVELDARKNQKPKPEEKRKFYAMLKGYAEIHGKTDKWVLANFRSKFKEWPYSKSVMPIAPDAAMYRWIKSRNIAYAKRMQKQKQEKRYA